VISRLPSDEQALELWDHVIGLARFPGFAEIKRSMRELPQLRALGVSEDQAVCSRTGTAAAADKRSNRAHGDRLLGGSMTDLALPPAYQVSTP